MGSLASVSDEELVAGLCALEAKQRSTMAAIIEHLVEMERRRLHLRLGYSSLYEYCLKALGLSEDEAYRRMTCARLAARQPEIVARLARGELSLTTVTMLKPHWSAKSAAELLEMAAGVSKRQLEKRLAARFPERSRPDAIERGRTRPTGAERWRVEAEVGESTRDLLERALDLMMHTNPERALEPVLEKALGLLVAKLEKEKRAKAERPRPTTTPPAPTSAPARPARSKARPAIPRATVRATYQRDQERCSFIAPDGWRCEQRHFLEIDHRTPWSRTHDHSPENLRVLCRAHNQLLAARSASQSIDMCTVAWPLL
ncbi:MAG TPA: HNH endonuclease signature motif containing protein [Polyangiaceae bacterium]|nr:HNH endonuclease signature motif containing protein [Polyangiaceae bacterium]